MRIEAVVLAAGSSRRMGTTQKLLCRVNGKPLIRHVIDAFRENELEPLIVLGPIDRGLQIELEDCMTAVNPDHEKGMGSSLAFGIAQLPEFDGVLVALGDHFGVSTILLEQMVREADATCILRAHYPDSPIPHPVFFPAKYRADLEALTGDQGAKSVLQLHRDNVREIEGDRAPIDIDTPDDLRRVMLQWK